MTVEHIDDPRFTLLADNDRSEHGLRIDPETGVVPPPAAGQAPPPTPPVVQAPMRADVDPARRRASRLVMAALAVPVVAAVAVGVLLLTSGGDSTDAATPPARSAALPPPPSFAISTAVGADAPSSPGIAVAPAGNGGLWYQAPEGALTRLASDDASINYAFDTSRPALALGVSGHLLVALVAATSGDQLIYRDRGSGRVAGRVTLPRPPVCRPAAVADCALDASDGGVWLALDGEVARVEGTSLRMTPLPGVQDVVAGGRRAWAVAGGDLVTIDAAGGAIVHRTSLRSFTPVAMLASGGALWLAGSRPAGPALLQMDVVGRLQRTIPLPAPVTSLAAAGGALWLAMTGQGVRELDPAHGRLAGSTIAIDDPGQLLTARPDQLWAVRQADGRARFTRIDLTPLPG